MAVGFCRAAAIQNSPGLQPWVGGALDRPESGDRDGCVGARASIPQSRLNLGRHFQGAFPRQTDPGLKHLGCSVRPLRGRRRSPND
jgi:hypothetical protein